MISQQENELLTRIGPGTRMGSLVRSYWMPALSSDDVEAGGKPVLFRLLGEDLVCFRAPNGGLGVLGANCPHRCAPLELARNDGDGALECIYHGWKVCADGTVFETRSEPDESRMRDRIRHTAYPVAETNGVLWVYMGEREVPPDLPRFEWMMLPPTHIAIIKGVVKCNWGQVLDGLLDSSHVDHLHKDRVWQSADSTEASYVPDPDHLLTLPSIRGELSLKVEDTPYGFRYGAIRRSASDGAEAQFVRITPFIMPAFCFIPVGPGFGTMTAVAPIDDEHTMMYKIKYAYAQTVDSALFALQSGPYSARSPGSTEAVTPDRSNSWLQDRVAMMNGTSYSGLHGSFNEDVAVAEGMGAIVDRRREHLGASDRAIVHARRLLIQAALDKAEGRRPLGEGLWELADVRSAMGTIALGEPWQSVSNVRSRTLPGNP